MDDSLHVELAMLEEELSKLKNSVEYIESAKISVEAAESIISNAKNLQIKVSDHAKLIESLIGRIDKVDFPSRLDKLDTVIATINQNISNLQSRLESIERSLKDDIKQKTLDMMKQIEDQTKNSNELFHKVLKKQNMFSILLFLIILLIISIGILNFLQII